MPVELHPFDGELSQIDVSSAVAAGDVVICLLLCRFTSGELFGRCVIDAHVRQPGHAVTAAVSARNPRRVADG
ncbi:Uncharacterised protein [Mycobacteroides abscessus subsp. abscessus]|nr:Uncharacterised protein [Mycobacteroides abscessus subsp. abscessus]